MKMRKMMMMEMEEELGEMGGCGKGSCNGDSLKVEMVGGCWCGDLVEKKKMEIEV